MAPKTDPDRSRVDDDGLLAALLDGLSYAQAAAEVGCSKRSVQRRMSDPDFRTRYIDAQRARAEQVEAARIDRLVLGEERADDRLLELLDSENEYVALKAVALVKELRSKDRERAEIVGRLLPRLAAIERSLGIGEEQTA